MEYIGTIFACLIAFWLGCVFGMLGWKKQYKKGYSDGSWDGMAKYLEKYWEWSNEQQKLREKEKKALQGAIDKLNSM